MQDKKQQLDQHMEQQIGSKLCIKAVYCHSAYLTYMQSTSYEMLAWMTLRLESNCRDKYQQPQIHKCYHFKGRKWRGTKEPLDEGEREESETADLKLSIQKNKIMASSPITSWQIEGEKVEKVTDFIFLGSKITADSDYSHEIKRHLLLGKKAMTSLNRVLKKNRDITILKNVI